MRTERRGNHLAPPDSGESDNESNLSTQAQCGGRSHYADVRFEALNGAPRAQQAIERQGYERTMAGLDALIADTEGTKLADKALVAKFAMTHLYSAGLKPKLGGSLASHLRGVPKEPKDVDIEMPSATELDAAFEHLRGRFSYKSESLKVSGDREEFDPGVGALLDVKLNRSAVRQESAHVGIDLVNENTPAFNRELVAPERTGSPAVGTTDTFRLVINAIDRRINKPETSISKRDASTVSHLLRDKGYHPSDPSHWRAIHAQVASKLRDPRDATAYMNKLHTMLSEYADERAGRSRGRRGGSSKKDGGCEVM
jgi:hypothetical protein